jgi:hypothetical protein
MIALDASNGKGLEAISADHGFVNGIIKLPDFGQGAAKLNRMITTVA